MALAHGVPDDEVGEVPLTEGVPSGTPPLEELTLVLLDVEGDDAPALLADGTAVADCDPVMLPLTVLVVVPAGVALRVAVCEGVVPREGVMLALRLVLRVLEGVPVPDGEPVRVPVPVGRALVGTGVGAPAAVDARI